MKCVVKLCINFCDIPELCLSDPRYASYLNFQDHARALNTNQCRLMAKGERCFLLDGFWCELNNTLLCKLEKAKSGDECLTFMIRQNRSISFYHSYHSFIRGFGNLTSDFWLGLTYLYLLTGVSSSAKYHLRIEVNSTTGETGWADYANVRISKYMHVYKINVGGKRRAGGGGRGGGLDICFLDRSYFSTYDIGVLGSHCVKELGAGWFYSVTLGTNGMRCSYIRLKTIEWYRAFGRNEWVKLNKIAMQVCKSH